MLTRQCTLVADEAEKIDQSPEIMSTLKTGYQFKSKVPRVNMNTGKQESYYPYGFKIIIAERSPDERKARGVLDRTFVFNTYHGKPKYDIKEILKPAGDIKRQSLLNELIDFRKLLLVYRLNHFQEYDGKKSIRYQYAVTDPNDPEQSEKYFTASKRDSVQIDTYLSEGKSILKLDRIGAGKETLYIIRPA